MYLLFCRLNTSLTLPLAAVPKLGSRSPPRFIFFCQVKLLLKVRPCDKRLVAFICRESYQVLPSGSQATPMPVYCGNGRKAWNTVWLVGKPGYGALIPCCAAAAELRKDVSSVRSAGLLTGSMPNAFRRS